MGKNEEYCTIKKEAIETIYNTMIKLDDRIKQIENLITKLKEITAKTAYNQSEIIPWVQAIEEVCHLTSGVITDKISKEEYSEAIEEIEASSENEDEDKEEFGGDNE